MISTLAMVFIVAIVIYYFNTPLLRLISHDYFWKLLIVPMVIIFCSGHMWNAIRGPNFISQEGKTIKVFLNQLMMQNGIESLILTVLISVCSIALLSLSNASNDQKKGSEKKNSMLILLALILFVITYSSACACFREKGMGYPFGFFY